MGCYWNKREKNSPAGQVGGAPDGNILKLFPTSVLYVVN